MRKAEIDVQNKSIYSCTNSKCVLYVFVFHVNNTSSWSLGSFIDTWLQSPKAKYIAFYIRTIGWSTKRGTINYIWSRDLHDFMKKDLIHVTFNAILYRFVYRWHQSMVCAFNARVYFTLLTCFSNHTNYSLSQMWTVFDTISSKEILTQPWQQ